MMSAAGERDAQPPLEVLLCPVGSIGDLHPVLALGVALRKRGRLVTVLGNELFADAVAAAGCEFVAVQSAEVERAALSHPDAWSYGSGRRRHLPLRSIEPLRRTHEAIVERYRRGRTVVAALNWCLAARLAQESHGVPTATIHLNAFTLRSDRGVFRMPPPMLIGPRVPAWYVRWQYRIVDQWFIDPLCKQELNAFRSELGLPPISRVMHRWCNSPDRVIGMFPEWWAPPQPEWPESLRLVGFPVYDAIDGRPLDPSLHEFLNSGSPPIVFTPGASGMHTRAYFAAALEACRRLDRRALLITNRADAIPQPLPAFARHVHYAPFRLLLPHVAAVVHQAGIGTVSQCLRAGVPQVCVPTIYNQPDTAERLRRFDVAQTVLPKHFSADTIGHALQAVLDCDEVPRRCRELSAKFDAPETAAERAADLVEELATMKK